MRPSAFTGLAGIADTIANIGKDPYLSEVACRAAQIVALRKGAPVPVMQCPRTAPGLPGGVGLSAAVKPMRAYVTVQKHPALVPLGIAIAIGLPVLLGYYLGKRKS